MSRTGQFGRLPKSAPDLSGTIVALMREYAAQVDQNMVDAWKNGGKVDGKAVTDERLLKHLRARRDELDKSDPMWAQWDNRMLQYSFSIDESKMRVRWDNHQASEGEMAAFYRKWEKRTPDNTEFDRSLRSSFGQWANAANARGRANSAAAKAKAHDNEVKNIYDTQVKTGESLNTALVWLAKQTGIIPPGDSSNLTDTRINQSDITQLLDIVSDGKSSDPKFQPAVDQVTAYMKKIDPHFKWGQDYVNTKIGDAQAGYNRLIKGATSKTEANQWAGRKRDVTITNNRVAALTPMADYIAARELWESKMKASNNDPSEQREITKEYLTSISGIYTRITSGGSLKGTSKTDEALAGPLAQEVDYLTRGVNGETLTEQMPPTLFDNSTGTTAEGGSDANGWTGILNAMNDNYTKAEAGGWAEPVTNPSDGSTIYKWHDPADVPRFDMTAVPGSMSVDGKPVMVFVAPQPVAVVTIGPDGQPTQAGSIRTNAEGKPIDEQGNVTTDPKKVVQVPNIGFSVLTFPGPGGDKVTMYQSKAQDGSFAYTLEPPVRQDAGAEYRTDGQGNPVVTIHQQPDANGVVPNIDPSKYNSITSVPPDAQGHVDLSAIPNAFNTKAGAMYTAAMLALDEIGGADKDYPTKRNSLYNSALLSSTTMLQQADELQKNGLGDEANKLRADAANINADLIKFRNVTTNGMALSALLDPGQMNGGRGPVPIGDERPGRTASGAADAAQIAGSRQWLLGQVDAYDKRAPAFGDSGAPKQFDSDALRADIATGDPRSLKLPQWVTDQTNPFSTPGVQTPSLTGVVANVGTAQTGGMSPTERDEIAKMKRPSAFDTGLKRAGGGIPAPTTAAPPPPTGTKPPTPTAPGPGPSSPTNPALVPPPLPDQPDPPPLVRPGQAPVAS